MSEVFKHIRPELQLITRRQSIKI